MFFLYGSKKNFYLKIKECRIPINKFKTYKKRENMTILIPVDSKNRHECIISSIEENKAWAFITLDEGKIANIEFYDRREDLTVWIDSVVVINDLEYVWPFMDEGIIALIAPSQKSIDEIVEAFLFKDLHDFSI